jgi:hypothetical protein
MRGIDDASAMKSHKGLWASLTPWKAGTCILAVGLSLSTVFLLDWLLPGSTDDAVIRHENGVEQFTIKTAKSAFLEMAFFVSFFGWPIPVWWLFRKPLREEWERKHQSTRSGSRASTIAGYVLAGILGAFFLAIVAMAFILKPTREIHRIRVAPANVQLESLYRQWNLSQRDIRKVYADREIVKTRGGRRAEFTVEILLQSGARFRSVPIHACPDEPEDALHGEFFRKLKAALAPRED